jgi:predicted transcriptional regulator
MSRHADWLRRADAAILQYFDEKPDYVPLAASRLGLELDYAQRRCEKLAAEGVVEPVSHEVVYRTTELGEQVLATYTETEGEPQPGHATVEPAP